MVIFHVAPRDSFTYGNSKLKISIPHFSAKKQIYSSMNKIDLLLLPSYKPIRAIRATEIIFQMAYIDITELTVDTKTIYFAFSISENKIFLPYTIISIFLPEPYDYAYGSVFRESPRYTKQYLSC